MSALSLLLYTLAPLIGLAVFLAMVSSEYRRIETYVEDQKTRRLAEKNRARLAAQDRRRQAKANDEINRFMRQLNPSG